MNEVPGLLKLAQESPNQNSYIDPVTSRVIDLNLKTVPLGIANIGTTAYNTVGLEQKQLDAIEKVMAAPSELYTDILGPDGQATLNQVNNFVQKQFIQQFYEAYMAPVAAKDVINRLGTVVSVVSDVSTIFPNGIVGVMSASPGDHPSTRWRTAYNYSFKVVELPKGGDYNQDLCYTFNSIAFPPFRRHEVYDLNNAMNEIAPDDKKEPAEKFFDMQNLLYRQNKGTSRNPAFKAVNDNIQIVQYLLSRCFGIESTYMTEWDLSMYIQEGLCSYIDKDDGNGGTQKVPKFITNLTYGLIEDSPVDLTGKSDPEVIEEISTYASVNMAVSTKMAIDGLTTGSKCNELSYEIAAYPLSKYWYPPRDGQNDEEIRKYGSQQWVESEGRYEDVEIDGYLNVPEFISTFFAYDVAGEIYSEHHNKSYTALQYRGRYLSNSSKSLLDIIHYNDARNAILTGWLSTDTEGEYHLASGLQNARGYSINHSQKSNAYSYIPYWKLFYASPDDGMSEYDIFMQDIVASDAPEMSFLNVAYTVMGEFTSDNEQFTNFTQGKANEYQGPKFSDLVKDDTFDFNISEEGFDSVGNISLSVPIVGKITIPHTKLLNMFLKKDKEKNKAMAKKEKYEKMSTMFDSLAAKTVASQTDPNTGKPIAHTEVGEDGVAYEVTNYEVPTEENLSSNLSYGDGVANYSPMMYGGPHGRYLSPLTLEGYTQLNNELLAKVPTMDPWYVYTNSTSKKPLMANAWTKNYKLQDNTYADALTVLTMNEREAVLRGDPLFEKFPTLNNFKNVLYGTGYDYDEITSANGQHYHYSYYSYGSGRGSSYYTSWRTYDYGYRRYQIHNGHTSGIWSYRGYWNSRKYGWTSQYVYEDCTVSIPDESTNTMFKLIPVLPNHRDDYWACNKTQLDWHIDHDVGFYKRNVDDVSNKRVGHCIDYIIAPDGYYGSLEWANGSYNTTYSQPGTAWYDKLKKAYDNGTSEVFVSLPISLNGSGVGDCMGILCGVATISKSQIWAKRWVCQPIWYEHSRRCWWRRHYWWCCHWCWGWQNYTIDTYNLILRTDRLKYFYPFKQTIDRVASIRMNTDKSRNRNVADTIMRWSLNSSDAWGHVNEDGIELFPLLKSFINRYGVNTTTRIPGRSSYENIYTGSLLKTNGVFFGDMLDVFRKNGYSVKQCTGVQWYQKHKDLWTSIYKTMRDQYRVYRYGTNTSTISLPRERGRDYWYVYNYWWLLGRWWSSKSLTYDTWDDNNWWDSDLISYTDNQSKTLHHWANQYRNEPLYGNEITALTDKIHESFSAPAVLEYYQGINVRRQFFKVSEIFDIYIDIATQQIAWLKELSAYANRFLTDENIIGLYEKSTDPKIQKIAKNARWWQPDAGNGNKPASPYLTVRNGPFSINPTEDVNYVEALEILLYAYTGTGNVNTLKSLVDTRIKYMEFLLAGAKTIKGTWGRNKRKYYEVLEKFSKLVHNTKHLLHGVRNKHGASAESTCFSGTAYNVDSFFETKNDIVVGESTYNIISNPAAMLWAYLNVLYQNRKYWINLRMNKMAGSYWNLRNLERVLTFILANNTAADDSQTAGQSLRDGEDLVLLAQDIKFVQARKSFQDLVLSTDPGPTYTGAVWTTVEYIHLPEPESSAEYDAEKNTYKGREIVYVPEVYKYAYKPTDGLYYIVSEEISNKVKSLTESNNYTLSNIAGRNYTITAADIVGVNSLGTRKYRGIEADTDISKLYENLVTLTLVTGDAKDYDNNVNDAFINDLILYKKQVFKSLISQYLIGIYIKWRPEHVWTGTDETGISGNWYVDTYQEEVTNQGSPRERTDLWGIEHVNEGKLSSGITFGVTEGFDMDLLLSNLSNMKQGTVMETLCAVKDGKDWWRIELPPEVELLKSLLKTKPKLVPAYIIDPEVAELNVDEVRKSTKTALVGAENTLSPIKEPKEDLLTATTAVSLGLEASNAIDMFNIMDEEH